MYSMLRATISMKHNVDITIFSNLIAFLKRQSERYRPKKSIHKRRFQHLFTADDQTYLALKVILIVGVSGGCRKDELLDMVIHYNVEGLGSYFKICIPDTKTKRSRTFVITKGNIINVNLVEIVRKYTCLRPKQLDHNRFFLRYSNGKYIRQLIGNNTFSIVHLEK